MPNVISLVDTRVCETKLLHLVMISQGIMTKITLFPKDGVVNRLQACYDNNMKYLLKSNVVTNQSRNTA